MRNVLPTIFLTTITLAPIHGQERVVGGAPPPFPSAKGTSLLHRRLPSHSIPDSLKDLADQSSAVVEAYLQATLPPQEIPARSFFTDAVLLVERVFEGPADLKTIVVGQPGGFSFSIGLQASR
jgi:hypothetical protein